MSWSTSGLRVRLVPFNMLKPSSNVYWQFNGGASFVDPFCFLCFMFVSVISALLSMPYSLGKGWPLVSFLSDDCLCLYHFRIWCPGSGLVLHTLVIDLLLLQFYLSVVSLLLEHFIYLILMFKYTLNSTSFLVIKSNVLSLPFFVFALWCSGLTPF